MKGSAPDSDGSAEQGSAASGGRMHAEACAHGGACTPPHAVPCGEEGFGGDEGPSGRASSAGGSSHAGASDAKRRVLERLLAAHAAWFDVRRDFSLAGRTFPGYAEFHSHGEQYVLVKRVKLWEVDVHEHLFFEYAERLDVARLFDLVSFMKTEAVKRVEPKANHMTTYLSLVVIADEVDGKAAKAVRAVRFRKDFRLGLWGWADLRLAVVDLAHAAVVTNAAGKSLKATLEANAFLPDGTEEARR